MNSFEYYNPVKVMFSENSVRDIGEIAAVYGKRALLVSYEDVSFLTDAIALVHESLHAGQIECIDYFNVTANPTIKQARQGIEICKSNEIELVIGLGGGSVMDCAKAIAAGVLYDGDIVNMFVFSHSNQTHVPPARALPTIMIPTLPATGSEMNPTAVLTNEQTQKKSYIWAESIFPKVAIIDPTLTVGLPPYQTACGAIDTIAHVVEAYFNGNESNLILQDNMQEGVIRAVMETLPVVLKNPNDLQARGVMMWAANVALNGWINSGTMIFTPMHQLGHVLSAQYNATHGATLACLMPAWMRFFAQKDEKSSRRCRQFAQRFFSCSLSEAADRFEAWMKDKGVQTRISEFGVKEEDLDFLAQQVREVSFNADDVLGSYPPVTLEEVREVYRLAL